MTDVAIAFAVGVVVGIIAGIGILALLIGSREDKDD